MSWHDKIDALIATLTPEQRVEFDARMAALNAPRAVPTTQAGLDAEQRAYLRGEL